MNIAFVTFVITKSEYSGALTHVTKSVNGYSRRKAKNHVFFSQLFITFGGTIATVPLASWSPLARGEHEWIEVHEQRPASLEVEIYRLYEFHSNDSLKNTESF